MATPYPINCLRINNSGEPTEDYELVIGVRDGVALRTVMTPAGHRAGCLVPGAAPLA